MRGFNRSRWLDVAAALVFVGLSQAEIWLQLGGPTGLDSDSARMLSAAVMLVGLASLAWLHRDAMVSLLALGAAIAVNAAFLTHTASFYAGFVPLLVALYFVASAASTRSALAGTCYAVAVYFLVTVSIPMLSLFSFDTVVNIAQLLIVVGVGRTVHHVRSQNRALRAQAETLARLEGERAQEILELERGQIARELHDVIAHSVSLIAVQAGAAEQVLDRDPARAKEPLQAIQTAARQTIDELRRLLGVLRSIDQDGGLTPQPGIDALPLLAEQVGAAGLAVDLTIDPSIPSLTAGLELTTYRIVQEALTNALKHGGATAAEVFIGHRTHLLTVRVRNNGAQPSPAGFGAGHGLIGMRERAGLYGGDVVAGPSADGGYQVTATVPTDGGLA